jgi:hypothetical protein
MSSIIKRWLPILLALFSGWIVLAGYLMPDLTPALAGLRDGLLRGAVVVAAFAFILGVFNILHVHSRQVLRRRPGWPYSLVLLLALVIGMTPGILETTQKMTKRDLPIVDVAGDLVFDHAIRPLGASLAALLAFTLALAAFRLLRTRHSAATLLFLVVVGVVLLGSTPLVGLEWLADIRDWIVNVPGMAGARGLLLGVALGTLITGVRMFLTIERPYSES